MIIWNLKELFKAPSFQCTDSFKEPGLKAIFYDSIPYNGKPVKVFAWLGIPKVKKGRKVPGMVLVHGGLGTAFSSWVKTWTDRGYAAIAMDTCGGVPDKHDPETKNWTRHKHSGPHGWGRFDLTNEPPQEQWPCHAVASVILAHSLLRSFPEIDSSKIGITGVSWGGILSCITAGIDDRLTFAAPVYGCGFLDGDSIWNDANTRHENYSEWLKLWDPSIYLKWAKMPFLWLNGTNDVTFPVIDTIRSSALTKGQKRFSLRVRMPHSHGPVSENPLEILDFAESVNSKKELPPLFGKIKFKKGCLSVSYASSRKIVRAELNYTRASGYWTDRFWNTVPAEVDRKTKNISVKLPYASTACFFNIYDDKELMYSSPLKEI